ncbi:sulfurtransferase TusA family protein [Shimia haliotis]|uniref:tRNA 2-thiouridine synthesizing protein A n=1 Tax=Shimia haliotis TaxID=1280847 RepID=A0A1I4B397_9RHOB|nr:sulfurtransferase TusA family protein [Shimia haliotis]SFK63265.1 tRNA 2-thiouridine synthesizing protein A [Shimia haliotis]
MDLEIDALGLLCPLPVLRLRKRMMPLESGAKIRLIADDPAAIVDVPHFCNEAGHTLLSSSEKNGQLAFVIQKA